MIFSTSSDPGKAIDHIRAEIEQYLLDNPNLQSLVIGISGGIDSALVAALCKPVCDKLNIKLLGYSLPIDSNTQEEIDLAKGIGKCFCTEFEEIDLTDQFDDLTANGYGPQSRKLRARTEKELIRLGNIKARMRMMYLYDKAQENNGCVLSTDNWTEYLLGFWTNHGDCGDISPIQRYWKTEVYAMATYILESEIAGLSDGKHHALQACIDAVPTDGLGITESDLDQLEASSYEEVDSILYMYLEHESESNKDHEVIQRHERTHFKRNNPLFMSRHDGKEFAVQKISVNSSVE